MNFIGGTSLVKSMKEITPLHNHAVRIMNQINNEIIEKNIEDRENNNG